MKKSQQYITLFFAIIVVFLIILISLVITQYLEREGKKYSIPEINNFDSLYVILDTQLGIPLTLLRTVDDLKNPHKVSPIKIIEYRNLIDLIQLSILQNNFDLVKEYCVRFRSLFSDDLCIKIGPTDVCNICNNQYDVYSFKFLNNEIQIGVKINKENVIKDAMTYVMKEVDKNE
ncbi:MAG: hypothetical protein QXR30_02800 [Candidatus Woesearchaeota archaeon]